MGGRQRPPARCLPRRPSRTDRTSRTDTKVLGEFGAGSFGRVYQARQLSTDKSVAIKLLSLREGSESCTGREAERFRREARIGATLSHTNIVELMDAGETQEGQLYATFAHVPGETLAQALSRQALLERLSGRARR